MTRIPFAITGLMHWSYPEQIQLSDTLVVTMAIAVVAAAE